MKNLFLISLFCLFSFISKAEDWFVGAGINTQYMLYEEPIGGAIHAGLMLNVQKGLTFDNEWRIGFETGYMTSLGMNFAIVSPVVIPGTQPTSFAYTAAINWIPIHATIGYYSYKYRRKINPYGTLALGYAIGNSSTTLEPYEINIGGILIEQPGLTSGASWGAFSGNFRVGALFELSNRALFLDVALGYNALYGKVNSASTGGAESIDLDDVDATLVNGGMLFIGLQYRFIKAR